MTRSVPLITNVPLSVIKRHIAHEHVLLLNVADGARAGFFFDVPDDQAQRDPQRRRIGHAALLAFLDVIFRPVKSVGDKIELRPIREIPNREHRFEHGLQTALASVRPTQRLSAEMSRMKSSELRSGSALKPRRKSAHKFLRMRLRPVKDRVMRSPRREVDGLSRSDHRPGAQQTPCPKPDIGVKTSAGSRVPTLV